MTDQRPDAAPRYRDPAVGPGLATSYGLISQQLITRAISWPIHSRRPCAAGRCSLLSGSASATSQAI